MTSGSSGKRSPLPAIEAAARGRPGRFPLERPGPAGGKRDRNRQARIEALCRAGLELFLSQGIESVTIEEIARRAGVAKGSFYRYFADKTDLVETVLAPVAESVREALVECERAMAGAQGQGDLLEAYGGLAVRLAAASLADRDAVLLYLQECRAPALGPRGPVRALADEISGAAVALTRRAHAAGLLRQVPAELSALAVVGAAEHLMIAYLRGRVAHDPGEIGATLISVIMEGLGVD